MIALKIRNYFLNCAGMNFEHHAPRKKKYLRGNNKPFMTIALSKPIMERMRIINTFLKNPIVAIKLAYTKERNFCVSLLRKVKRDYFAHLNETKKNITDNRKFWQAVKAFLSEKSKSREKITLIRNEDAICDDVEVANTLNNCFSNIFKNLKIQEKFVTDSLLKVYQGTQL